jgi:hypothetical protein
MANIRHAIRLCERHAEEWVPDPNEIVCLYCESLTCGGPLHKYVPASQLAGAEEDRGKLAAYLRWRLNPQQGPAPLTYAEVLDFIGRFGGQ